MAALRHAARRLGVGGLQRAPRVSPVRQPMSTTSNVQPKSTAGPQDELRMEYEDMKEELFDLCLEMRSTGAFKTTWENLQNLRLTTHLAAQVKPKPDDPNWRRYRLSRRIYDFQSAYYCLGFFCYTFLGSSDKNGEVKSEADILSDAEPANERLN